MGFYALIGFSSLPLASPSLANAIQFHNATGIEGVYAPGDIAWTLASTALVWIMIPGVGFFYSGLLRRKNALSMIYLSMMTLAVVSFQVSALFFFSAVHSQMNNISVVFLGVFSCI